MHCNTIQNKIHTQYTRHILNVMQYITIQYKIHTQYTSHICTICNGIQYNIVNVHHNMHYKNIKFYMGKES